MANWPIENRLKHLMKKKTLECALTIAFWFFGMSFECGRKWIDKSRFTSLSTHFPQSFTALHVYPSQIKASFDLCHFQFTWSTLFICYSFAIHWLQSQNCYMEIYNFISDFLERLRIHRNHSSTFHFYYDGQSYPGAEQIKLRDGSR